MTGLALYDNRGSSNALKVRFLLAELGLEVERREVAIGAGGDAYLAVHPFGLVPALVDGDIVITESNAALRHLARRAGADELLGGGSLARRARVDVLLDALSLEVRGPLWAVEEVAVYGLAAEPDEHAARTAALTTALTAYERLLAPDGPYAAGPFTIADCALAGRLVHLEDLGLDPSVAPRLRERVAAARARPAFAHALENRPRG